jgi:hypothetical protein
MLSGVSKGYEILTGLRDNPDDPEEMHLFKEAFDFARINENGVERLGRIDVADPPASQEGPDL